MEEIKYIHINAKEFSYIFGYVLNVYQELKSSKRINFNTFYNSVISDKQNDSFIEAAYSNNKLIGFISYGLNEHYKALKQRKFEITLLCVLYEYQSKGIATKLLNNALINILENNIQECSLLCSKDFDPKGYDFWTNKGFEVISESKEGNIIISQFYIDDINKILENKTLTKR